jgi:hypothetical protein
MPESKFLLLGTFRETFAGHVYRHRSSSIGNRIARQLYEDLFVHQVSKAYAEHVENGLVAVDLGGKVQNKKIFRRNDSVLGRLPAGSTAAAPLPGFHVRRGLIADARIGCEVKIIAKDPLSQIDRVISDLSNFAGRVRKVSPHSISVAIVGVNHEPSYLSYEGDKTYEDTLLGHEPVEAIARIDNQLRELYDELLVLSFRATNRDPYPFAWVNARQVAIEYGSMVTRLGEMYQARFR